MIYVTKSKSEQHDIFISGRPKYGEILPRILVQNFCKPMFGKIDAKSNY